MTWPRRAQRAIWAAILVVGVAIGLSFALPFLGGLVGGDAVEAGFYVGVAIGMPAFLLLLPVLALAVVLDVAVRRIYPAKPIVASWDVRLDGGVHVVSIPASGVSPPDHAWVDGARVPLAWTQTGAGSGRAVLDAGVLSGTLTVGFETRDVVASLGILAVTGILGAPVGSGPGASHALHVVDATVEAISVAHGLRQA